MLDRRLEFDHIGAGNHLIKDRDGRLPDCWPISSPCLSTSRRLTVAASGAGFAQAFDQSVHARQTQGLDQLVGRRFVGVG